MGVIGSELDVPELVLDAAETPEKPFVVDENVDQSALLGGGGSVAIVVFSGKGIERGGVFAGENLEFGVYAGLESVEAGTGFAGIGAGTAGFLSVTTICFDLFEGTHAPA